MKVYLVGSLRNPRVPDVATALRVAGFEVFDDWMAAGPEADDYWQRYEQSRGHSYIDALQGHAARHVFEFDKQHLDDADVVVLVAPGGKSAHLELGYAIGSRKLAFVLMEQEPERWDVMLQFATDIAGSLDELVAQLQFHTGVLPREAAVR